jgi:hypothetical protein
MVISTSAMECRYLILVFSLFFAFVSCKAEKPMEQKNPATVVIVRPRPLLNQEQRKELGFPVELIAQVQLAAGAKAEPFFSTVVMQTENLKGEKGFETKKLAGFSVYTRKADDLIASFRASLRRKGYLIFKSHKGYGTLPDIVTVVKGNNSYDILKVQETEGTNYNLDTGAIIAWLKARQHEGSFVITGAGSDWIEAQFIKPPKDMATFAKEVIYFAPDVLVRDTRTVEKLTEQMQKTNGFYLTWD